MNALWKKMNAGQLTISELPEELDLSDILSDMKRLWQLTVQDGCERGECILLALDGRLMLEHEVVGWEEGVNPMHPPSDSDDHLGSFTHIHSI
jgi:hypothetical protein